ncbi:MAG: sensor histidine kinase [Phenylobacterium sp.]|uniref:sensor histidine kinase n=1 Tax=Phenylobacterium sp. TaxID=1871053 RepID=UPI001224CF37|nr:PAS domain-containing sensor histidine kinase [Phenylobacterium sp.]TAJ73422.1 MAG: sensor histidine kinase [Phenylobacterium sp.]
MTAAIEGRMARLVREFDWAATALGPAADWPAELKTAVSMILESRFPAAIVWGPGLVTIYNDAFLPILGDKPEALGRSFADVWAEVWDEIGPIAARAYAGEATFIEDFPLRIDRSGHREPAWFTFCYSPLRLSDGSVAGLIDTVMETTATVRAREDLVVLNDELRHRLKNTLATFQALARGSLRTVADRAAVNGLMDRIVAMGAAHDVLFREGWTSAAVEQVARATLAANLDRVRMQGPQVPIGARAAVALSLVLHELATNAAKYGALSATEGRVDLWWAPDETAGVFRLHWRETGGPAVRRPERTGLGSRLIDMGLSRRGTVSRRYPPAGFEADLEAPLAELTAV